MTTSKTILGLAFSAAALTTGSASAAIVDTVTIDFEGMAAAYYSGHANIEPVAGGNCPGAGGNGCYYEDGFAIGIVADPTNPIAHVHQNETEDLSFRLGYHADAPGIYIRALDGAAFSLRSMDFLAPLKAGNRDNGPDDVWEILGFNTALNPDLASGDGTNYLTRVAYQTVANGFDGTLELDEAFNNINAFWIHYKGYPVTPADGKRFNMELDNVVLGAPVPVPAAVWLFGTGLMGLVSLGKRKASSAIA